MAGKAIVGVATSIGSAIGSAGGVIGTAAKGIGTAINSGKIGGSLIEGAKQVGKFVLEHPQVIKTLSDIIADDSGQKRYRVCLCILVKMQV